MHLSKLNLFQFKSYQELEVHFSSGINCLVGENGEGKTNLLDAIHYLSLCKSYFNGIDSQNVLHGAEGMMIQGNFVVNDVNAVVHCGIKKGKKKTFKRNDKVYKKLADHVGLYPLVMISPNDIELILGGSEVRRKFVNGIISQYDKQYLNDLITYNRVLLQRNALLKRFAETSSFDLDSIEIWDMQMAEVGARIYDVRKAFLEQFIPLFDEHYKFISGGKESVNIEYRSQLNEDGSFSAQLKSSINKDRVAQHSTLGIHKDDLVFELGGRAIKRIGSQGQQKSYLLGLKLAQFNIMKSIKAVTPVLLLDDIFDKLDDKRIKALMTKVDHGDFGQIFVTDTNKERVEELFKTIDVEIKLMSVKDGEVMEI